MTGKELLSILTDMTDEQLKQVVEVHDHKEGEWIADLIVEYTEDHGHIVIDIKY